MDKKSVAGGVLGIIGAVFALIATLGLAVCAGAVDALSSGSTSYEVLTWILGLVATAAGVVGAVMSFKKAMLGGILQLVALVVLLVLGFTVAFSILSIIAMILLGLGGILSFVLAK